MNRYYYQIFLKLFLKDIWHALFGRRNFLPSNRIIEWLADKVCVLSIPREFCENLIFLFCGPSKFMNQVFKYLNIF